MQQFKGLAKSTEVVYYCLVFKINFRDQSQESSTLKQIAIILQRDLSTKFYYFQIKFEHLQIEV